MTEDDDEKNVEQEDQWKLWGLKEDQGATGD